MRHTQTIVVTGSSRGIGEHICSSLSRKGYNVIGLSRSGRAPDNVQAIACDVGDYSNLKNAVKATLKDKTVYGLINAAGIASMNLAISTPPETVKKIIQTNLIGTINTCILFSKRFARNKCGRIINFSTIAVPISLKGESIYIASKAGVEGFSRSFAREMADFNTTVNIVSPGPIATDLISNVPEKSIERIINHQILPTQFAKTDISTLVEYLLSKQSSMLSGQIFNVGGI